jgi:cellulose synthase operon protein C
LSLPSTDMKISPLDGHRTPRWNGLRIGQVPAPTFAPQLRLALPALLSICLCLGLGLVGCSRDTPEGLIASGKQFAEKKEHKAAAIQFKAALQLNGQSGEARYLLGQALLDSGDAIGASTELTRALDLKYTPDKVVPAMAKALLLTGDYVKLTSQLGNIVLENKQAAAGLRTSVAAAWSARGERPMADEAIRTALETVPDFGPALTLQTRLLAGDRSFDQALELTEKLLKSDPKLLDAWLLKGDILLAARKDNKGAEAAFRKALEIDRTFVAAHLAIVAMKLSEPDLAAAKAQAEQLRAVLPGHPQSMYVDAAVAFNAKDLTKARELTQLLMRMAPTNLGILQLAGAVESQLGSLALAESFFAKALQIDGDQKPARRGLAQVYLRLGQYPKVLQTLQPMLGSEGNDAEAQAMAGEAAMRMGNARASEVFFNRAAQLNPNDPRVGTAVALSRLSRGDISAGFSELQSLALKSPEIYADQALVSSHLTRRDLENALKAANAMLKKQPESSLALETLGRVQVERKDYPAARLAFEQALQKDPTLFVAISALAALDLVENKPDAAQKRLEAAVQADPRSPYPLMALAELSSRRDAPLDDVRKLLTDAISAAPSDPAPRLQLIELNLARRQYREALAAAQEAGIALPNNANVLDAVGRAQMEAGNLEQALNTFRKMAAVDTKSPLPYTRLADVYKTAGKRGEAEVALKKALEIDPSLVRAQAGMADLLFASGRKAESLVYIQSLKKERPNEPSGYLIEGAYHRRVKNTDAAVSAYRAGLEKTNDATLARELYITLISNNRVPEGDRFGASWIKAHPDDASFEFLLADLNIRRGAYELAEAQLRRVVVQFPDNLNALNNLAWTLASRGKPGAPELAQKAVDMAPNSAMLLDTLAYTLVAEKKFDEALKAQKRAVELAPNQNPLRLNLARIATQAGDKVLAREELARLKGLGTSYKQQAEVKKLLEAL